MPAARRYYSTADVQAILGISRTKSNQIMHMFEYRGQLFRDGTLMRVEIETFERWLREQTKERQETGCDSN